MELPLKQSLLEVDTKLMATLTNFDPFLILEIICFGYAAGFPKGGATIANANTTVTTMPSSLEHGEILQADETGRRFRKRYHLWRSVSNGSLTSLLFCWEGKCLQVFGSSLGIRRNTLLVGINRRDPQVGCYVVIHASRE